MNGFETCTAIDFGIIYAYVIIMALMDYRASFTEEDLKFVVQTLDRSLGQTASLESLVQDHDTLEAILEHDVLHAALIDNVGCLQVSPTFYFYVLTGNVLRRAGIRNRTLCRYLTSILVTFSKMHSMEPVENDSHGKNFPYISDLLIALEKASSSRAFHLQVFTGNYALFISGMFLERVEAHARRHGAPGIGFYEGVGMQSFHLAAHHPRVHDPQLVTLYEELGDEFHRVRLALNEMSEKRMHFHDAA